MFNNSQSEDRPKGKKSTVKKTSNSDNSRFSKDSGSRSNGSGSRYSRPSSDSRPSGSRSSNYDSGSRSNDSGSRYSRPSSDSRPSGSRSSNYDSGSRSNDSGSRYSRPFSDSRPSGSRSSNYYSGSKSNGSSSRFSGPRSGGSNSRFGGGSRSGSRGGSRYGGSSQRSRGGIKRFNPSDFIQKVEEKSAAPVYIPKNMFADFAIEKVLKQSIANRGYEAPTPIQDEAIPLLLEGKDIIATANTGTGKTAAFLIPMINNVITGKAKKVLIIAPTRELASQIQAELALFRGRMEISSALCIGGLNISFQLHKLRKNPQFVIGTPGRLKDLENHGAINFSHFSSIVLDEVDTMLDMGFITDIQYIISKLPQTRQSLFFSATIPFALKKIMADFLKDPASVSVKTRQSAENVNQDVVKVGSKNKVEILHELLIKPEFTRTIIFLRTKRGADALLMTLQDRGFGVTTIHGNKTQGQRKKALQSFKDDRVKILLATDVVARGIDIDSVSHVINFDLPQTHEDYIHRIGRTGRANKIGQALTFID